MSHRLLALLSLLALAACSSLPINSANGLRDLDYLNDDIASLLIAVDVPLSLEPIANRSTLSFDIRTAGGGERLLKAALVETDAGDLAGSLPPPANDRTYFLFGFADPDKTAIREAQAWAKSLPQGTGAISVSLDPRFCRTEEVDLAATRVSVLVALPGASGLSPMLLNQSLQQLLASSPDKTIPLCAGHSG